MVDTITSEDAISPVSLDQLSVSVSNSSRVSMEESYKRPSSPNAPLLTFGGGVDSPPSYDADADALLQSSRSRRKYNIQPREDEGRETLPGYSSEISVENVFSRKTELEGAIHRAPDRNWYRVFVTLQGTALTLHQSKPSGYFPAWSDGKNDAAVPDKKGQFLKSYNLQHADVGIASDYYKKRYVIRVRAETDQFLLSCFKIETFLHWLQSLFAAIDIAQPLDTRSLPRDLSNPQIHRRRVYTASLPDLEQNATLVRDQFEITQRQYPRLVDPIPENSSTSPERRTSPSARPATSHSATAPALLRPSSSNTVLPLPPLPPTNRLLRLRTQSTTALASQFFSNSNSTSSARTPVTHPSVSPETGKWRPEHRWSAGYDLMYAKRCMAVLTSRSPRKSNVVIMEGKQWTVDWETGTLTRCEPPDYGECIGVGVGERDVAGADRSGGVGSGSVDAMS